jgi:hypothetical protein
MHFTYKPCGGDLQQGDLLRINEPLQRILADFHPYYSANPDYKALMVLTQSCDLVRRGQDRCKSPYINLCAVRALDTVVKRELTKFRPSDFLKTNLICDDRHKEWAQDFLLRLFNNNQPEYFYLHDDSEAGVKEQLVAFLQLAVAIKADHYDVCLDARYAQLNDVFQAKLGWLTGHIYSRVATVDWGPPYYGEDEFDGILQYELNKQSYWFKSAEINALKRFWKQRCIQQSDSEYRLTKQEISDTIAQAQLTASRQNLQKAVDIVLEHARQWRSAPEHGSDEDLESELLADREFTRLF